MPRLRQAKPYRTIVYFHSASLLRAKLKLIGAKFTETRVLCEFWGTQFDIAKPTGKGAAIKMSEIDKL